MQKTICELFAGVGGFRLGFDRLESGWKTTWFSQWEPGARTQWAHNCYVQHFGDSPDLNNEFHTGEDISTMDKQAIPDHTLLVGGFPCQDYSVAHTLSSSHGIEGKKGVLWWQIRDTIIAKNHRSASSRMLIDYLNLRPNRGDVTSALFLRVLPRKAIVWSGESSMQHNTVQRSVVVGHLSSHTETTRFMDRRWPTYLQI